MIRLAGARSWLGWLAICAGGWLFALAGTPAFAQLIGIEAQNNLMPASGAMGGTSLALPQDLTSAINGNPACLTQFHGTQFMFSGTWAEPTYDISHAGGVLPDVGAFDAKSTMPGSPMGNIGVTQDFSALGMPVTFGLGFISGGGGGVDFRQVPASNGTNSALLLFEMVLGAGVTLTDRWSAGAGVSMGIASFDGPFVGIGGSSLDYALRGSLGINYLMTDTTNLGFYYQTKQSFRFDDAIMLDLGGGAFSPAFDINMDLPPTIGFGVADRSLMDGNLLVSADVLYKMWNQADLFNTIYDNQWAFLFGTQYTSGPYRLRAGYSYVQNATQSPPGGSAGGVAPPGAVNAVEYLQAQMANFNRHRITAGVGVKDALPGVDVDLVVGGMLPQSQDFGPFSSARVVSYWVGFGITWRFGRGDACEGPWECP